MFKTPQCCSERRYLGDVNKPLAYFLFFGGGGEGALTRRLTIHGPVGNKGWGGRQDLCYPLSPN